MAKYYYTTVEGSSPKYYLTIGILSALVLGWLFATYLRFVNGMWITGMSHSVTWAWPKVIFVLFVGLSAGSFIISALSGVFGQKEYKVLSRIAGYMAVLFMVGALTLLITDWGRPDRIILTLYMFNFRSLLSINAFLYTAYIINGIIYLWAQFKDNEKAVKVLAITATVLAIGVHSGTGFIFGIANAREMAFTPITPIAFVVAALSSGTAMAMLVLYATFRITKRSIDMRFFKQLSKLLLGLIFFVIYLMVIEHSMHLYVPEHQEGELFVLFGGNFFTWAFWAGLIGLGGIVPVALLLNPATRDKLKWILTASALHVFGVLCERILIILPGQVLPVPLLPGYEVNSAFLDGQIFSYVPSAIEIIQTLGATSLVALLFILGVKIFPLLPVEGKYVKE